MGRRVLLLAGICLAVALGAQAQAEALPQWAFDIAKLMGGAAVPTNPNGIIVQKHDKVARPSDGLVVKGTVKETDEAASPYQYVYQGPVAAGAGSMPIVQQYPYAVLALQTAAFLKVAKYVDAKRDLKTPPPVPEYFVQVESGNFIVGADHTGTKCRNLYPAGFNKFELVENAAGAPIVFDAQRTAPFFFTGPETVRRMLVQAKAAGLDLLRVNFFAADVKYSALTPSKEVGGKPVPNEGVLRGIDYILHVAQKLRIRVLPVLTDYFSNNAGGPLQYLAFAGKTTTCTDEATCDASKAQFYTDTDAKAIFKDYIASLINRVNSINGRVYKDDPTIWGWDIMNEPRCTVEDCVDAETKETRIGNFVVEIADYVRSLDSKHLITVGLEGWYIDSPRDEANPFPIANTYGSDWVNINNLTPNIDFAELNVYPDKWGKTSDADADWLNGWIDQHSTDAKDPLVKPVIIKEFGMRPTALREPFFKRIVDAALETIGADRTKIGGLKGALYWQGWIEGTTAAWFLAEPAGRFGMLPTDPAYDQIELLAAGTAALERTLVCPANKPLLLPQFFDTPSCRPGFEGPECLDINECVRGTDNCDKNAACINNHGSFTCQCFLGYSGTGSTGNCEANPTEIAKIVNKFEFTSVGGMPQQSNGLGTGFDNENSFVPYPKTGPGYNYDPTGYYESTPMLSAMSRRLNMTVEECATACDSAQTPGEECTSFFYNEAAGNCVLKKGECRNILTDATETTCKNDLFLEGQQDPSVEDFEWVCGFGYTYFRIATPNPTGCEAPPA